MYGHIAKIAEAEKAGIEAAGGNADVYQLVPTPSNLKHIDLGRRILHSLSVF